MLLLACGDGSLPVTPGTAVIGDACTSATDCASGVCLATPGGYCSSDCAATACPDATTCQSVVGTQSCLKVCGARTDCRDGYMCFHGACQPSCTGDPECGSGFMCTDGQCTEIIIIGKKNIGEACMIDDNCASALCDSNTATCQRGCVSDERCAASETCYINPIDTDGDISKDAIRPICIARRTGVALGATCKTDANCLRGSCQLGLCTNLCEASGQCVSSMSCQTTAALLDIGSATIKTCIPRTGTLTVDLGQYGGGPIAVPSGAQGMNIYVVALNMNTNFYTGIVDLSAPDGTTYYTVPKTLADYYANKLRYDSDTGTSMVLLPNAPGSRLMPGLFQFTTFAQSQAGQNSSYTTKVRLKFGDAPFTTGRVALQIFITNLTSSCKFQANNSKFETTFKNAFAGNGFTITGITYKTVALDSDVVLGMTGGLGAAGEALVKAATTGGDVDALEIVIVNSISPNGVLGVASGIPAATGLPGTPHSGAIVSTDTFCDGQIGSAYAALVSVHELGHTLGLFHNTEMDGHHSPLGDDVSSGTQNIMYWEAYGGTFLSTNQRAVIGANPSVAP